MGRNEYVPFCYVCELIHALLLILALLSLWWHIHQQKTVSFQTFILQFPSAQVALTL